MRITIEDYHLTIKKKSKNISEKFNLSNHVNMKVIGSRYGNILLSVGSIRKKEQICNEIFREINVKNLEMEKLFPFQRNYSK